MAPILEVKNLQTHFHTPNGIIRAVDGVSFSVDQGKTLGIVGESGSGKSVTSLSIMQLLAKPAGRIAGGEIRLEGRNLLDLSDREMRSVRGREIAMIFQDPMTSLNPVVPIGRQIGESLLLHMDMNSSAARTRVVELLDMVGIPEPHRRVDEYPHRLSGGMRQRVMIAMALACTPKVLIADEPTTALDVTIQAQILELVARLQREFDMAVIIITHDLGVVAGMADDMAVMYGGRIVESGPTDKIFAHPRMPYTMGLLNSMPRIDDDSQERLVPIPGAPPNLAEEVPGCHFAPRCDFTGEICFASRPTLREVAVGQMAACHFDVAFRPANGGPNMRASEATKAGGR